MCPGIRKAIQTHHTIGTYWKSIGPLLDWLIDIVLYIIIFTVYIYIYIHISISTCKNKYTCRSDVRPYIFTYVAMHLWTDSKWSSSWSRYPYHPFTIYLPLHLVDFHGKCTQIYHTWMVWNIFTSYASSPSHHPGPSSIHTQSTKKTHTIPCEGARGPDVGYPTRIVPPDSIFSLGLIWYVFCRNKRLEFQTFGPTHRHISGCCVSFSKNLKKGPIISGHFQDFLWWWLIDSILKFRFVLSGCF